MNKTPVLSSTNRSCPKTRRQTELKDTHGLAGVAQWIERRLRTKRLLVQFPVRAHAWVAGRVSSRGCARSNHTLIFLSPSLSPSLSLSLKIKLNKILKKKKTHMDLGGGRHTDIVRPGTCCAWPWTGYERSKGQSKSYKECLGTVRTWTYY